MAISIILRQLRDRQPQIGLFLFLFFSFYSIETQGLRKLSYLRFQFMEDFFHVVVSSITKNDEQAMVIELSSKFSDCNIIFLGNLITSSVQGCPFMHAFLNMMKM